MPRQTKLTPIAAKVVFDDEAHRTAVQRYLPKIVLAVDALPDSKVMLDPLDIAHYAMFRRQRNAEGLRSWRELRRFADGKFAELQLAWRFSDGAVRARFRNDNLTTDTQEMGVAVSLGVVSQLLELSEPDWERIPDPPRGQPDLDFRVGDPSVAPVASNGLVELESKGTLASPIARDAAERQRLGNHRRSIRKKKDFRGASTNMVKRIGAIGVFPTTAARETEVRLLDPPGSEGPDDPRRHRLIARLVYYHRLFRMLTGAELLTALADRITVLQTIDRIEALDGVPLTSRALEKATALGRNWSRGKTRLWSRVAGRAFEVEPDLYVFLGADFGILSVLRDQHHDEIIGYRADERPSGWWQGPVTIDLLGENIESRRQKRKMVLSAGFVRLAPSGSAFGLLAPRDLAVERLSNAGWWGGST